MKYFSFPNQYAALLEVGIKFKILFHLLSFEKKLRITLKYLRTSAQWNPLGVQSWRQHSIKSFSERRQWDVGTQPCSPDTTASASGSQAPSASITQPNICPLQCQFSDSSLPLKLFHFHKLLLPLARS